MTVDMFAGEAEARLRALGFRDWRLAARNLDMLSAGPLGQRLGQVLDFAASSPSPDGALNELEAVLRETPQRLVADCLKDDGDLRRLVAICGSSPFLSRILARNADFFEGLFAGGELGRAKSESVFKKELDARTEGVKDSAAMAKALRVYRQREFLRLGARDLLGLSGVEELTAELSGLASASLSSALNFSLRELKGKYGPPLYSDDNGSLREAAFAVIGLGKLGGSELNFSSDIDIIYIYSSDRGETKSAGAKAGISLHEFFSGLSAGINRLISGVTEDGFVFRIDLNLRPEGRSGDMANSLRSLEIYYESWGQTWERSAMIKASHAAGDGKLSAAFLDMIKPFVFRRHLDFGAIEEIKSMKERIDLGLLRTRPDALDVKLGKGGIREIEFFCQALQLIYGGKDPEIRERNTLRAIEKLLSNGYIESGEACVLREGYVFLRRLEHRIQIVDGLQSQTIPAAGAELERIAVMMGFGGGLREKACERFLEEYGARTQAVHAVYRTLFYRGAAKEAGGFMPALFQPDASPGESEAALRGLGFMDAGAAAKNLARLLGAPEARLTEKTRRLLRRLAPLLLKAAASAPDPDMALTHMERFISSASARPSYCSLIAENPSVADELARLFGSSVFLSRILIERPEGIELLLSREPSEPYRASFLADLDTACEYEDAMDRLRRLKNEEVFRIGVDDVLGNLTPREVSVRMTVLAEACLGAACRMAANELARAYGTPGKGAAFAVIGLGKLGGRELSYGSDLDIVFLYSGDGESESTTGPKEISNHEFFVKLGQRVISILTLRTKEGFVFNVDVRLRPSGSAGPLVVSRSALLGYYGRETAVWERLAFVRARAVAGDVEFADKVLGELSDIIYSKTLSAYDIKEVLRIRGRMEAEIAKEDLTGYNVKTGAGGLVDIEFLTHALQLKHGRAKKLRTPCTLKALKRLSGEGIIAPGDLVFLRKAYGFLRLVEARLRVVNDRAEGRLVRGSGEVAALARSIGYSGEDAAGSFLADYAAYAKKVRALYIEYLGRAQDEFTSKRI